MVFSNEEAMRLVEEKWRLDLRLYSLGVISLQRP